MAESSLTQSVDILKRANQTETFGYLFLLKRLAYVNLLTGNHALSFTNFQQCCDITPVVTPSPINLNSAKRNVILSLMHQDMEKAIEYS